MSTDIGFNHQTCYYTFSGVNTCEVSAFSKRADTKGKKGTHGAQTAHKCVASTDNYFLSHCWFLFEETRDRIRPFVRLDVFVQKSADSTKNVTKDHFAQPFHIFAKNIKMSKISFLDSNTECW